MSGVVSVDPFQCRMWDFHDRLEDNITEESCKAEIASFLSHGQVIPVLGRPLEADPSHKVELIYGARRLFIARHLNLSLKVQLRSLADREAIVAMDIENRQRRDICAYERGLSYSRWLRAKKFESQDEIARALKISASQVSRLIKIAQLPSVIVGAFGNPNELHESWGLSLYDAWQDPGRCRQLAVRARAIAALKRRPSASDIYQRLMSSAHSGKRAGAKRDHVVKDEIGAPLFRMRRKRKEVVLIVPATHLTSATLDKLLESIGVVLRRAIQQAPELAAKSRNSCVRRSYRDLRECLDSAVGHQVMLDATTTLETSKSSLVP